MRLLMGQLLRKLKGLYTRSDRKLYRLHPVRIFTHWQSLNDYRLWITTKDGKNVLFGRIILVLVIVATLLGITYGVAVWFRAFAQEAGIIDVVEPLYFVAGFYLLAITGLIFGVVFLISSTSGEMEYEELMRSLPLTPRDVSFYEGSNRLWVAITVTFLLIGFPLLFFGKIVWRPDVADLLSVGLAVLLVILSFCILGNLLMSLVAICVPSRLRQRISVGLASFAAVLLVGAALYFVYVPVGHVIPRLDMPMPWDIEFVYLLEEGARPQKEWLVRHIWPILGLLAGVAVAGGVALRSVWPATYRLEKGPKKGYDADAIIPVRWWTRFVALVGRLPLDHLTKAFLKRDLILYFRDRSALAQTIWLMGVALAMTLIAGEKPFAFLYMLYFIGTDTVPKFLNPSLKTERNNLDCIRMLLEKDKFIAAKLVTTFIVVLFLCLILLFLGYALSPALEWDFGIIVVRILILSLAVLQASLIGTVFGEQVLSSGKQTFDQTIAYFFISALTASAWLGIDVVLTDPQMHGLLKVLLLPVVLVIVGGVLYYCVFRLKRFARAIEDM